MKRRIVIVGLDGATFDIINPLIEKGKMPNLARIIQEGAKGELFSSVPPISAPAWVSFLTGKNPGKHGVLGFQVYNLSKYNCFDHQIVSSNSYAKDTILDILSRNNKKVISFQVPLTYPVWPVNGIMVAGYPTPDQMKAFTYPDAYSEKINRLYDYQSDQIASGSIEEKVNLYSKGLDRISTIVENMLQNEDFDLYVYVNNVTDWVQHKFWKYRLNGNTNYIDDFYIKIDEKLGSLIALLDNNTTLIIMSDHGAGKRPDKFFNINYALKEGGFLSPQSGAIGIFARARRYWYEWIKEFYPMRYWSQVKFSEKTREKALNTRVYKDFIKWDKTIAYRVPMSYPYAGININLLDRQENGIVRQEDFYSTKTAVINYLKDFMNENPGLINNIYRQEDLFSGSKTDNLPDIIVEINHDFDSGSEIHELITEIPSVLLQAISGYHRPHGIFIAKGQGIKNNTAINNLNIMDIAPTVLYLLGLPVASEMDGSLITSMFEENYLIDNPVRYTDKRNDNSNKDSETVISLQEENDMIAALQEMGYI